MKKPKHGWNFLDDYISVHERVLRSKIFSDRMVTPKTYIYEIHTELWHSLRVQGIIFHTYKGNNIRVDVLKNIEVDPKSAIRSRAKTFDYTYSANLPKVGSLIRYCSPHLDESENSPDHHKFHHKHDSTSGQEEVIRIADDEWPHVDEFLREVLEKL